MPLGPTDDLVRRFRASLASLIGEDAAGSAILTVAVSGGPDSLALLLLAAAALRGRVSAATVDHGLRPESASEAAFVADVCGRLDVPHETLALAWSPPRSNRQASARAARYECLQAWAVERGADWLATAHHLDDQAETLLMRLHRGSGVDGLAGIRPKRPLAREGRGPILVRPLLGWRKDELATLVRASGFVAIQDPSNSDPAHDRTGARAALAASPKWPDRQRVANSADHLREVSEAMEWVTSDLLRRRVSADGEARVLAVHDLPPELLRRLAGRLVGIVGRSTASLRGDELARAVATLSSGQVAALAEVVIRPRAGEWRFAPAPPRRA